VPTKIPEIRFNEGWNLIGYPGLTPQPIATALRSIAGSYTVVFGYNSTTGKWLAYQPGAPTVANDLVEFAPGFGYWVRLTKPATWSCPCGAAGGSAAGSGTAAATKTPAPTSTPGP
jgi:hypothetical protein